MQEGVSMSECCVHVWVSPCMKCVVYELSPFVKWLYGALVCVSNVHIILFVGPLWGVGG